ncbi:putative DNA-binding transcriptional regulator YafY [Aureibacillus halotolerans]|uniref:Putative DNA-binding transcriptional regulator YafY n=2 Tax=Aureibacillus halotolerans TaxID=1508390 RepID=A0A4R6U748_9BACI|nr:putative DNA-binding transcriptional regulator YafY [Aureibacillus halotolerans]
MELLTKKRVTAPELAAKFEVTVRTIYRDMELINQSGIAVASIPGSQGGYELMSGFFLTKQHFSLEDFSLIYAVFKGMEGAVGSASISPLLSKLGALQPALLNEDRKDRIIVAMSGSETEKSTIPILLQSIDQSRRVRCSYTDAKGKQSERTIEPYNLLWEEGKWYVESYCLSRKDDRFFRVSRMNAVEVLEETFLPRKKALKSHEGQGMDIHLRFHQNVKQRVIEQFPDEYEELGDVIDVHTVFYSKEYALSVALSYGDDVRIMAPTELKDELLETIKRMASLYS